MSPVSNPVDGTSGVPSLRTLGTGAQQAAAGNDARLSDSRTPSGSAGGALDGTFPNPGLAASVAGNGLAEASDVLSVNVDNSSIEINADTLRVKSGGITSSMIADGTIASGDLSTALALSLAGWTVVTKTLDETVTGSTTLQDDDELFFTAANGTAYQVMFEIIYISASGAGTPDLKIAIGEDTVRRGAHYIPSFTSTDNAQIAPIFSDLTSTAAFGTNNINRAFMSIGTHVGAGGTFKLQWAQNTSSGSPNGTTIKAGSRLRYYAI